MTELLAHAALKGAVILGVALLTGLLLRRVAAARRYSVWMTAVAVLGMMPLAMVVLPAWRVLPKAEAVAMTMEWPVEEVVEMPTGEVPGMSVAGPASAAVDASAAPVVAPPAESERALFRFSWDEAVGALPWVWLAVAGLLLMRLGWGAWCLRRLEVILKTGTSEALNDVVREVGLKRVPRLLIGAENAVPMVWGVWKTRLLLPAGFAGWPVEKLRGVLLHELAHLKRRDPLALWTAQWVKALHWFNPLAWLTIRQLRADQERACDDTVLRQGVRASDYAQHLLDLSRHTRVAPGLSLCALTMTRCSPVESRVKAILDVRRSREGLTRRWLLGLAGLALLATVPVAMLHAIEGAKLRGRIVDRNGVVLAESTAENARHYPLQTLTAHVVGYTGKTGPQDATPTGRTAMEKRQDGVLRQGKDVALTLDARIQKLTMQAMQNGGIQRGAAVVMDPRTGEILASVSLPSYDANWFVPTLPMERFDQLAKDSGTPLFNRCFVGKYPPGAAFMPFTALAGLSAGVGNRTYVCRGSVTYGARNFQCWKGVKDQTGHGALNMTGALVESCNCYWYQFGNETGMEAFDKLAAQLGLGQGYGLDDQEKEVPATKFAFIQESHRRVAGGDVANISIGQGRVLLTPLQMAVLASTVANGGKVPQPKLVREGRAPQWRVDLTAAANVPAAEVEKIRQGMRLVVNGDAGGGRAAKSERVVIAAKTGTAQWRISKDQNLAVMIGFAPYDKPTLAFAILHEGATGEAVSGGKNCGPVVKRIVEEALALPVDGSGEVTPVKGQAGSEPEDARQAKPGMVKSLADGVRLHPVDEDCWKGLQRQGNLAPLPAGAVADVMTERDKQHMSGWFFFRFSAPREAVHPWLMDSLTTEMREQQAPSLMWPESPAAFTRSYVAANGCEIMVQCAEGERAHVSITKKKPRILIAPDEATPPTPKKAAPKELDGVVDEEAKPGPAEELKTLSTTLNVSREKVAEIEARQKVLMEKLRGLREERPLNKAAYDATVKEIVTLMRQVMPAPAPVKFVPASAKPPAEMEWWKEVQQSGGLAELPPEALVEMLTRRDMRDAGAVLSAYFRFTAPREKAHAWLMASLSEKWRQKQAKMLLWPKAPEAFYRAYFVTDKCHVVVRSEDGKMVSVAVEKRKLPILIAPDEATPPRPKTAVPKKLEGVVSADTPWRAPWEVPAFEMNLEVREATPRGDELKEALEVERRHRGVAKTLLVEARGR